MLCINSGFRAALPWVTILDKASFGSILSENTGQNDSASYLSRHCLLCCMNHKALLKITYSYNLKSISRKLNQSILGTRGHMGLLKPY